MTVGEMLQQSAVLAVVGMGVVFGFLAFMVFTVNLMGKVVNRKDEDEF